MGFQTVIGVIGSGSPTEAGYGLAEEVGRLLAEAGAVVLCGGLAGVMEAAAKGCTRAGGTAIGYLPGEDRSRANPYLSVALPTDMGHARNVLIARGSWGLISVEGELGTLSETALGLKMGKPVVSLNSPWEIPGAIPAEGPEEAVSRVLAEVGH